MSGERRDFIVLAIGDRDHEGYAEDAWLRLLQLIDSSSPDARTHTHVGIVGYYLPSPRAIAAVEEVISRAEQLRDSGDLFATLGIGLAHGPLIADFDGRGRVNREFLPVGVVANRAAKAVHEEPTYRQELAALVKRT